MKRIYRIVLCVLASLALVSCGGHKTDETSLKQLLIGDWILQDIDGDSVQTRAFNHGEEVYVKLSFASDGSFCLYQSMGSSSIESYNGTWELDGNLLTGKYSDLTPWSSCYDIEIKGDILTMKNDYEVQHFKKESEIFFD